MIFYEKLSLLVENLLILPLRIQIKKRVITDLYLVNTVNW